MVGKDYVIVLRSGGISRFWKNGEKFDRSSAMRLAQVLRHRLPPVADKIFVRKRLKS